MKLDASKILAILTLLESQLDVLKQECSKARAGLERESAPTPPRGKKAKYAASTARILMNRSVTMYKKKA